MAQCEEYRHRLDLYLDEELEGEDAVELEAHFNECPTCFEYVRQVRSFRAELREADSEVKLPIALRPEVMRALDRVDRRIYARRALQALPLAAAALAAVAFLWRDLPAFRPIVEPIVAAHAQNLPMEVQASEPQKVATWFRGKVPFAVRMPVMRQPEVRLVGARLAHLRERQAAYLTYQHGLSKYSLFVFDPSEAEGKAKLEVEGAKVLRIKNRQVFVAHRRGFGVLLWKQRNLVYSLASEAGDKELFTMAESIVEP